MRSMKRIATQARALLAMGILTAGLMRSARIRNNFATRQC
jgi:hypothetical protein